MDLRRLRYFVAVADQQHFGRAAALLHMSVPPLSQRIRELEAELGVKLFTRTSRRVALTDEGIRLLDEARAVLTAADRFEATASQLRADASASLGLAHCHGTEWLANTAALRFHERAPEVVLRPSSMTSLQIFASITAGRLDVGIVRAPVPAGGGLVTRLLARVAFDHLAVPAGHRLAAQDVVAATDLEGERVLLVSREEAPTYHDETVRYCAENGVRPNWVLHPASQVERALDMVAVGAGIAWLNSWQARSVHRDGVVIRPLVPVTRFDQFHLAWRNDDRSPTTAAFIEIAIDVSR